MNFQQFDPSEILLPPLAHEFAHMVADILVAERFKTDAPLFLVHDAVIMLTIDLLEASELSSPKFHGMTDEIPLVVDNLEKRSSTASRMLYISKIATTALCLAYSSQHDN